MRNRDTSRRSVLKVLLGLALACLSGCGYSSGVRLPGEAQSFGVTVFNNMGPEPRLERDLFASLSSQASRMLDAELRAPNVADVLIRGEIVDYRRIYGVLDTEGQLQQSGVRIMLRAWLEDRRSGKRLGDQIYFDQAVRYVIRVREEEFGARRDALNHLCQELVLDLFNQVDYETAGGPEADAPKEPLRPQPLGERTDPEADA